MNFEYSNISIQDIYQFLVITCIIFAFALFLYLNPNVENSKYYVYVLLILIVIFIIIAFSVYSNNSKSQNSTIYIFFGTLLIFTLLYYAYDYFTTLELTNSETYIFISQLFLVVGILVGMSLFFNIFSEKIRRIPGMWGFIINFIFYIPCIFSDIVGYIKTQLKLTPSISYLLLYIETLIIVVYFLLPIIYKDLIAKKEYVIMREPRFLNYHSTIASGKELPKINQKNQSGGELGMEKKIDEESRNNFSLSMWLYLNTQDSTTKVKHIFNYSGEPKIEYVDMENGEHIKKCKFTLFENTNGEPSVYYRSLEEQKWNHIVFNYNNNKCDLFINGILEHSAIATYIKNKTEYDKIEIGDDNLKGAICNISYVADVLTDGEIATNYNILFNKNPPLNNVV
jgi:hypothetical protein